MNFCTRCLKRFADCVCRRRRTTAVTVPIAIETTREIAAARWAALAATDKDSQTRTLEQPHKPPAA